MEESPVRKRFVIVAFCIFALPLVPASLPSENPNLAPAFATVALAGHNNMGGKCDCGTGGGCICDPGELPALRTAPHGSGGVKQGAAPDLDPVSAILVLALVGLLWLRLR
jgi:hypothetical protein